MRPEPLAPAEGDRHPDRGERHGGDQQPGQRAGDVLLGPGQAAARARRSRSPSRPAAAASARSTGRTAPLASAIGSSSTAASRVRAKHQRQRVELLDRDLDQQVRDAPGQAEGEEQEGRAAGHGCSLPAMSDSWLPPDREVHLVFLHATHQSGLHIRPASAAGAAALEQRGTVAATAEALHLTPSAVSQQLAGLSRDVGVQLLEKHGRGRPAHRPGPGAAGPRERRPGAARAGPGRPGRVARRGHRRGAGRRHVDGHLRGRRTGHRHAAGASGPASTCGWPRTSRPASSPGSTPATSTSRSPPTTATHRAGTTRATTGST